MIIEQEMVRKKRKKTPSQVLLLAFLGWMICFIGKVYCRSFKKNPKKFDILLITFIITVDLKSIQYMVKALCSYKRIQIFFLKRK